tara:strand:- start:1410 stop:1958 length:549 start_codon:yes stop_codon:yes gene_type:complete
VNKSDLRQKILKKRKKFHLKNLSINPKELLKILNDKKFININKVIGGYYPYNYEVNILQILKVLEKKKYKISLPKIIKKNQMNFYDWSFNEPLAINKYGIPEPLSKKIKYPDVLLIPLVAFDKNLNRLGYGGGYYDRYLAKFRKNKKIMKIGIAYSIQKIQKIPTNKYDIKLDHVITEKIFY